MERLEFKQNFMYEPFYSTSRGMIIYGEVFIGTLNITGVTISSQNGTEFGYTYPEFNNTLNSSTWAQWQIHPMYNFDWTTSRVTGFKFNYNLTEIYFERHSMLDADTEVTLMVGVQE